MALTDRVVAQLRATGHEVVLEDLYAESSFSYHDGNETIHTNARLIPEFGWYLIVEQAEGKATRQIFRALLTNLIICLTVTAIVLVLLFKTMTAYQNRIETLRGIVPTGCPGQSG